MRRLALARAAPSAVLSALLLAAGCETAYPEVVVVNRLGAHVLLRNPSFSGCAWQVTLADGDATSPGRCLPGEDRVHFQRLDLDAEAASAEPPRWFNYQSVSTRRVGDRSFHVLEVRADDLEQDFSVPGPFGH